MPALRLLICLALLGASSSSSCPAGADEQEEREDESLLVLHHARSRTAKSGDVELVETDISHPAPRAKPWARQASSQAPHRAAEGSLVGLPARQGDQSPEDLTQAHANHSFPGYSGYPGYGHPGSGPGPWSGGYGYEGYYPGYAGGPGGNHGYDGYFPGDTGGNYYPRYGHNGPRGYQGYYPGYSGGNYYPPSGPRYGGGYLDYHQARVGGQHGFVLQQSGGDQGNNPSYAGGNYPGNDDGQSGGQPGNGPWQAGGNHDYDSGSDPWHSGGDQDYIPGSGYSNMEDYGAFPRQHICDGSFSGTVDRRRRMGKMCSCRRRQSSEGVEEATDGSNYGWACKDKQMVAAKLHYTPQPQLGFHFGKSKSCSKHPACKEFTGDCCPTEHNVMLECCQPWSRQSFQSHSEGRMASLGWPAHYSRRADG